MAAAAAEQTHTLGSLRQLPPLQQFSIVLQPHTDDWWCRLLGCDAQDTDGLQRAVKRLLMLVHPDKHGSLNPAGVLLATQATQGVLALKARLCKEGGEEDEDEDEDDDDATEEEQERAAAARGAARMAAYQRDIDLMRGFAPDTVSYYLAEAALPANGSCDLGHALYKAYLSVGQKRKDLDDLLQTLRRDPSDKALAQQFTRWLQRARSEGECWNQTAAPFRRVEQPQSLGRACSAYSKEFVTTRPLFQDKPEWIAMELQLRPALPAARANANSSNASGNSRADAIELD